MIQGKWFAPGENLSDGVLPVRLAVFGISGDPLIKPAGTPLYLLTANLPRQAGSGGRTAFTGWAVSVWSHRFAAAALEILHSACFFTKHKPMPPGKYVSSAQKIRKASSPVSVSGLSAGITASLK